MTSPSKDMIKYEIRRQQLKRRRRMVGAFAGVVVVVAALFLMVPAMSLTADKATNEAGFFPEGQQSQLAAAGLDSAASQDSAATSATEADADVAADAADAAAATEQASDDAQAGFSSLADVSAAIGQALGCEYINAEGQAYSVRLAYTEAANIPEGAELAVTEILPEGATSPNDVGKADAQNTGAYADYLEKAQAGLGKDEQIAYARLFDIKIMKDGQEIQPAAPVQVRVELAEQVPNEDVMAVHFGEDAEVLDVSSAVESANTEVSFAARSFSVYGIICKETITTDFLSADGTTYHIEVMLDEADAITGTAELAVEEITQDSDRYEDYLYAASEYMFLESVDDISFARFFDIKIMKDGQKYEPQNPVQVKITYDDAVELAEDEQLSVVHFAKSGPEVIQAVDVSEDATELVYEQNGFSVTATVVAANNIQDGHQYVIYTSNNNNYYAMTHNSEGRDADLVYGVQIGASATTGHTFTEEGYGSNIVWTAHRVNVGGTTYYTFSYEEGGKTYYLRVYGGLMVGADSDIDENGYKEASRYQWSINDRRLRARYTNDNDRRLRYSNSNNGFRERDNNSSSQFYFADVSNYTQDVVATPTIHYVDESGNELDVSNANVRDWAADTTTTPAFLMYDIDGYDYVKSTLGSATGTEIRPILRRFAGKWQYTVSEVEGRTIDWNAIPDEDATNSEANDIYIVYRPSAAPVEGGTPKIKESGSTEEPVAPAIHKGSTSNGDGTNTISLSITADTSPLEVEKLADVIVIFDTSTSMRRHMGTSTTTYEANETPVGQYRDHDTRMWIAAEAVKDLANTLIGNNTEFVDSAGNKLIRMSLISFNRDAALQISGTGNTDEAQGFTENITTFNNAVNALTTEAGTNWEAALDTANHLAIDPERATFVIFVTDGNPSYRTSRGNTLSLEGYPGLVADENLDVNTANSYFFYRVREYFGALDETDERNYNTAAVEAKSIVDHSKNLYCIGIGNADGVSRLQGLTTDAYNGNETTGADRTKTAENPDELTQAFNDITASIVALLGWGDIEMTDGITNLANTVEKSHLVNVDGNFEYWKAPAPEGWNSWSKDVRAAYIQGTSGAAISYPDGYDNWTGAEKTKYEAAYDAGKNLSTSDFIPWNPTTENCNEAAYDEDSASVKWDMGHSFVPESGCTYRVTFRVWPSQEAYDILANLKNGTVTYDGLTDAQKAQIVDLGGGNYSLKTNDKDPSTTYKAARKTGDGVETTGDTQTLMFNDVDPMALVPEKMTVKKQWDYDIGSTHAATELKFRLMVGDKYYQNDGTFADTTNEAKVLPVSENTGWTNSINIAPGIVIFDQNGENAEVLETGHDYKLDEFDVKTNDQTPFDASYEFTTQTVRPMVLTVEGSDTYHATLAYLVKIDDDNPAVEGKDQFTIGDSTYYVAATGSEEGTVVGTNHRKAELDITKRIVDESGILTNAQLDAETFTYRVTLTVPKDTDCSQMTAYEYVYRADGDPRLNGNTPFEINGYQSGDGYIEGDGDKSGAHYRWYTIKKGNASIADSFALNEDGLTKSMTMDVTLKRKEVLRFTNLPSGTTYKIEEMYANYRTADPSRDADAPGSDMASNLADQGYTTTYKTKRTVDENATEGTGTAIQGEITDLDIRYYNQFTNTLNTAVDAELKGTKHLEGYAWSGERYYFRLVPGTATYTDGSESGTSPMPGANGRPVFYLTSESGNADKSYSFGRIRYTKPGTYTYTVQEMASAEEDAEVFSGTTQDNGVRYGEAVTVTVTVIEQGGKLVVSDITGDNVTKSTPEATGVVTGDAKITNSGVTAKVKVLKIGDSNTTNPLSDVSFELYSTYKGPDSAENVKAKNANGAEYELLTTGDDGTVVITDLRASPAGTDYYLVETAASPGYNLLSDPVNIKVYLTDKSPYYAASYSQVDYSQSGQAGNIAPDADGNCVITVNNSSGQELPSTGGIGTTVFTVVGVALVAVAVVLLLRRRK